MCLKMKIPSLKDGHLSDANETTSIPNGNLLLTIPKSIFIGTYAMCYSPKLFVNWSRMYVYNLKSNFFYINDKRINLHESFAESLLCACYGWHFVCFPLIQTDSCQHHVSYGHFLLPSDDDEKAVHLDADHFLAGCSEYAKTEYARRMAIIDA